MTLSPSENALKSLQTDLAALIDHLPSLEHGKWIQRALGVLVRLTAEEIERLDWKILTSSLEDMEQAFQVFYPYRHVRKVTIFGSARISSDTPEYKLAAEFAHCLTQHGFMVMTGAGGGIMEAGHLGAGSENSFGLNIQLPFEGTNSYIEGDSKLMRFKYFFTRKLFFLKESDAITLFPGGFGTQDEGFECLTLCQTGRLEPVPLVLIDRPGGSYWKDWDAYIRKHLIKNGLVSPEDTSLYTITDNVDVAYEAIHNFYRVYHSSRYVGDRFVLRLKSEISDADVEQLNAEFSDLLVKGQIEKSKALPEELPDETAELPRLIFYFNRRDSGRLYQLLGVINQIGAACVEATHPERK
ncbi:MULTISPECIES: LOG family protein [unclassified Coleofasciculus]|uniref:LOG family protein n=1 Tax=unclassified Coleofasciculus TaxID=2692782 RepID=UPI00187F65CD|nr:MULTISPECIES: LOG family protein [unclassified Coleofasciculus]MBE9127592.1 LOG family protein [Coleofasciculus sp. LEGE 07081]MBE9150937.1 LOG family protein [Coleofasciculus sp. LEGE 07092]